MRATKKETALKAEKSQKIEPTSEYIQLRCFETEISSPSLNPASSLTLPNLLCTRRFIPRESDGTGRQESRDLRYDSKEQRYDIRQQMPRERDGRGDKAMQGSMQGSDSTAVWAAGGGSYAGAPVRGGLPVMGLAHSQVPMHVGQPVHAHQQTMQDLGYQIERIQHIMNELNQLRLPNEIMLQLSDYITHLRKELHRLNLSVQLPPGVVPPKSSLLMEQHSVMMREPVSLAREPLARDSRGDTSHFSPRQEGRSDRARGDRPNKRQWGPAETAGSGTYIEREIFVGGDRGTDAEKQQDSHGYSEVDTHGKRGR